MSKMVICSIAGKCKYAAEYGCGHSIPHKHSSTNNCCSGEYYECIKNKSNGCVPLPIHPHIYLIMGGATAMIIISFFWSTIKGKMFNE